jgi:serine/threonine-protein kinase
MLLGNRYFVLKTVGKGGCAQTYLAEDTHLPSKRKCIVKQLKPSTTDPSTYNLIKERFEKEAEILEALGDHEQIPKLYAFFEQAGETYLVEQWFEGPTLAEKVAKDGVLDSNYVRDFLVCILPVLSFLHNNGVIHRDIKPDNIILREPDGMPVLIDFGTVKDKQVTVLKQPGISASIIVASWGYTAPEQATGYPVDASDIFSLGMTAIFMLTGQNPAQLPRAPIGTLIWWEGLPSNIYKVNKNLRETIDKAIEPIAKDRFLTAEKMESAVYHGTWIRCQTFGPKAYTPYMCKAFAKGQPEFDMWFKESLTMYPASSSEHQRGLMWKVY